MKILGFELPSSFWIVFVGVLILSFPRDFVTAPLLYSLPLWICVALILTGNFEVEVESLLLLFVVLVVSFVVILSTESHLINLLLSLATYSGFYFLLINPSRSTRVLKVKLVQAYLLGLSTLVTSQVIVGLYNFTKRGFPWELPSRDFSPDIFRGLYGKGGARLVTLIAVPLFVFTVCYLYRKFDFKVFCLGIIASIGLLFPSSQAIILSVFMALAIYFLYLIFVNIWHLRLDIQWRNWFRLSIFLLIVLGLFGLSNKSGRIRTKLTRMFSYELTGEQVVSKDGPEVVKTTEKEANKATGKGANKTSGKEVNKVTEKEASKTSNKESNKNQFLSQLKYNGFGAMFCCETAADKYVTVNGPEPWFNNFLKPQKIGSIKIKSHLWTLLYLPQLIPYQPILGVGLGNYSSWSQLLLSGVYARRHLHGKHLSGQEKNVLPVRYTDVSWNFVLHYLNAQSETSFWTEISSITEQPWSSWQSLYAEIGLFGLFVIFWIIYGKLKTGLAQDDQNVPILLRSFADCMVIYSIFFVFVCFVDNFMEYPWLTVPYFLGLLILEIEDVTEDDKSIKSELF